MAAVLQLLMPAERLAASTICVPRRNTWNPPDFIEREAKLRLDDRCAGQMRLKLLPVRARGRGHWQRSQCELRRHVRWSERLVRLPENHRGEKDVKQETLHAVPPFGGCRSKLFYNPFP